jgi:hypothetical protein
MKDVFFCSCKETIDHLFFEGGIAKFCLERYIVCIRL